MVCTQFSNHRCLYLEKWENVTYPGLSGVGMRCLNVTLQTCAPKHFFFCCKENWGQKKKKKWRRRTQKQWQLVVPGNSLQCNRVAHASFHHNLQTLDHSTVGKMWIVLFVPPQHILWRVQHNYVGWKEDKKIKISKAG